MSDRPFRIVLDKEVSKKYNHKFYRLEWPDGTLSADFYNWTRAKDNLKNYDWKVRNMNQFNNGVIDE